MFMQKIEAPQVTCDLFEATSHFEGTGNGSSLRGDKPRSANEREARAYADFLRRKLGLPEIGKLEIEAETIGRGANSHFYYVGATYGDKLANGDYATGSYSILFPGANAMQASVTMETLDEAGEVVASSTLPVEPKKGGVVWKRDEVRKAAGKIEKPKATPTARTGKPKRATVKAERAKRERAIRLALRLRAQLRRERAISGEQMEAYSTPTAATEGEGATGEIRPVTPEQGPTAAISGEAFGPPAPGPGQTLAILAREFSPATFCIVGGQLQAWLGKFLVTSVQATNDAPLPLNAMRVAMAEAMPGTIAELVDAYEQHTERPKRTPAHERAIRRAWRERKAGRKAMAAYNRSGDERRSLRKRVDDLEGELQRANALSEGRHDTLMNALAEVNRQRRAIEAAEADNAQLWQEIEALTAPQPLAA